jgi:hypothetical protein
MDRQVKALNVAGGNARMMAKHRRSAGLLLIFLGLLCVVLFFCANLLNLRTRSIWVSICCLAGLTIIGRGVIPQIDFIKKREGDAIRGAEAEEAVGAILNRLPENYMVLNDVPGLYGNIDHVVLRKDGAVFVIETKSMSGRVSERNGELLLNGKTPPKDFVGQTLRNAVWVRDILAAELGVIPWVDAALVFTRASVSVRNEREEIQILSVRFLEQWMARSPQKREIGRRAGLKWEQLRRVLHGAEAVARSRG